MLGVDISPPFASIAWRGLSREGARDQEPAAGEKDRAAYQQADRDPEDGREPRTQVRADSEPGTPVRVHHDDRPRSAARAPDERPGSRAGARGRPEMLFAGSSDVPG